MHLRKTSQQVYVFRLEPALFSGFKIVESVICNRVIKISLGVVYGMIAAFQPNAFYLDPRTNLHTVPDRFDFIYYSFSAMTSLGAAGITPVSSQARSFTIVEAILGVLYLAVLIAGLIGAYRAKSSA